MGKKKKKFRDMVLQRLEEIGYRFDGQSSRMDTLAQRLRALEGNIDLVNQLVHPCPEGWRITAEGNCEPPYNADNLPFQLPSKEALAEYLIPIPSDDEIALGEAEFKVTPGGIEGVKIGTMAGLKKEE